MIPVKKNILFKPFVGDEKSEGGLFVPEIFRKPSNKGVVVEVGGSVTTVKKGDVGFRVKDWGQEVSINGELHFLMDESAIIAKQ